MMKTRLAFAASRAMMSRARACSGGYPCANRFPDALSFFQKGDCVPGGPCGLRFLYQRLPGSCLHSQRASAWMGSKVWILARGLYSTIVFARKTVEPPHHVPTSITRSGFTCQSRLCSVE
eukprot:930214-Prymnesium_polylepis.1